MQLPFAEMWTHERERYRGDQDRSLKYVELKVPVIYIGEDIK